MPGISDTAYPRLKPNPSAKEMDEVYTPNLFECGWVEQRTREPVPRIGLLVLLKTFQRLGYFVMVNEVPNPSFSMLRSAPVTTEQLPAQSR